MSSHHKIKNFWHFFLRLGEEKCLKCNEQNLENVSPLLLQVSGSVVLGGVAMLFKENGATVLGVCVAYDVLIHSQQLLWRSDKKGT